MRTAGIIAEFNPFHYGHKYLVDEGRRNHDLDCVVAVMSGNFVQRGEYAIYDKYNRAEMALKGGVDLVVELPTVFATSSAGTFARGGVKLLEKMGAIDFLLFGTEEGELSLLKSIAFLFKKYDGYIGIQLKKFRKAGFSYPRAREEALINLRRDFINHDFEDESSGGLEKCFFEIDESELRNIVSRPNNLLAIEYLSHLTSIKPLTIKRFGKGYHQSATQIRERWEFENSEINLSRKKLYLDLLKYKIMTSDKDKLKHISGCNEGIENRIIRYIRSSQSVDDLIEKLKSKAYTRTRLSRLLIHILLEIEGEYELCEPEYIRVLGANSRGIEFLNSIKKNARLPIISNINKVNLRETAFKQLKKDILAGDIYNLITGNSTYENSDFIRKPIIF